MISTTKGKYIVFASVLVIGVLLDQVTKFYAAERLATTYGDKIRNPIILEVSDKDAGKTVEELLTGEFTYNSESEVEEIASRFTVDGDEQRLSPETELKAGDTVKVLYRKVTVIDKYWDFEYTENRGAAFGILSEGESPWRHPFFVVITLIAMGVIGYMMMGIKPERPLAVWGLSLIAAGAVGNFIDRLAYGAVIDFVVWKYTDAYRWPTFNVADSLICIGVGLMVIEILRGGEPFEPEAAESESQVDT